MPTVNVARMAIVPGTDQSRRLRLPQDIHAFFEVSTPDVNPSLPAVIFFKYNIETANIAVKFFLNGTAANDAIVNREFEFSGREEAPRTFHEIFSGLQVNNNLDIEVAFPSSGNAGHFVFSDIVILYQSRLTT